MEITTFMDSVWHDSGIPFDRVGIFFWMPKALLAVTCVGQVDQTIFQFLSYKQSESILIADFWSFTPSADPFEVKDLNSCNN